MPDRLEQLASLESEVGIMMRRVRRVIAERASLVHEDLPGISYLMLGYVGTHGPVRASQLGVAFHVDKAAVSRHLQQMLELGLLDRRPDPEDGRATLLTTTPDAEKRLQVISEQRRRWLDERLTDWGDDELASLVELLGRYNRTLDGPGDA